MGDHRVAWLGMSLLTPVIRDALTGGHLAHLVTVNADGSPQVSIVWLGLDGDDLVTAHLSLYQKLRNVERDPRVVVSMETGGSNQIGMAHHLVVHGTARIVEGGAPELLQRLAHVYLAGRHLPADAEPAGRLRPAHHAGTDRRRRPRPDPACPVPGWRVLAGQWLIARSARSALAAPAAREPKRRSDRDSGPERQSRRPAVDRSGEEEVVRCGAGGQVEPGRVGGPAGAQPEQGGRVGP